MISNLEVMDSLPTSSSYRSLEAQEARCRSHELRPSSAHKWGLW
jgi:hypothetical protein